MENCAKKIINGREYITTEEKVIIRGKEITVVNNRPIKSQEEENDMVKKLGEFKYQVAMRMYNETV